MDNLILCGRPLVNRCCMCCSNEEPLVAFLSGSSFLVDVCASIVCAKKSCGSPVNFLSGSSFFVDVYASVVWDRLGHARFNCGLITLLISLAREA